MENQGSHENGTTERRLSDSHSHQIKVLKTLSSAESGNGVSNAMPSPKLMTEKYLNIYEIAELSGLKDEKEVQRYLFILEGQKLVSPFPEGDFTSKTWFITRSGVKALKTIQSFDTN